MRKKMMCEICGQNPCHPRCPNAPEPKEVHICSECLEGIYPGDRFYESCGSYVCEECLKGMPLRQGTKKIKHTSYGQKRKICHIAPVSRRGFFFISEQVRRINQYTKFTKNPLQI